MLKMYSLYRKSSTTFYSSVFLETEMEMKKFFLSASNLH